MSVSMKQVQKKRVAFSLSHSLLIPKRIHAYPFINGEWLDSFAVLLQPGDDLGMMRTNVEALANATNLVHITFLRERTNVLSVDVLQNNDTLVFSDVPRRLVPATHEPHFAHTELVACVCFSLLYSVMYIYCLLILLYSWKK